LIIVLIGAFYIAIAVLVARLCSINSRWEEIVDRIPAPRVSRTSMRASLLPDDEDLLDESNQTAPHAP
jgi:hypothetical protein